MKLEIWLSFKLIEMFLPVLSKLTMVKTPTLMVKTSAVIQNQPAPVDSEKQPAPPAAGTAEYKGENTRWPNKFAGYVKLVKESPKNWPLVFFLLLTHGVRQDIIANQAGSKDVSW